MVKLENKIDDTTGHPFYILCLLCVGNVEDMTKLLKSLFPGTWDSCVLECMEDGFGTTITSVAQSESSSKKCLKDCLFDKPDMASAWLRAVLCSLLSIICNLTSWCLTKNLHTCNFGNVCLNRRYFTCLLIIFSVFNSILFIVDACLETKIIENSGYSLITTAVCYILLFVDLTLVLIFVKNARAENLQRRNADKSKDAQTRLIEDTEESQQVVAPPLKNKEISAIINLQRDDSLLHDTSC